MLDDDDELDLDDFFLAGSTILKYNYVAMASIAFPLVIIAVVWAPPFLQLIPEVFA